MQATYHNESYDAQLTGTAIEVCGTLKQHSLFVPCYGMFVKHNLWKNKIKIQFIIKNRFTFPEVKNSASVSEKVADERYRRVTTAQSKILTLVVNFAVDLSYF